VDAKGGVTTFEYDQYGQKIKMTDPEGRIWRYEYDQYGNLRKLIYPDGSYTETTYDLLGRPIQIRDRKGQVTTITYNAVGQPVRVEYSDGSYVEYAYDGDGQVIAVTESGRGTTSYTYDNAGRLIAVTDPEVGTIQYEYDLFGTKTKVIYPNGWQVRYEYRFKMIEQRIWKGENDCDPIPALTKVIDPLGYEITYNYSPWVQLQKSEAIIEKDANGNPTKKLIAEFVWDTENMLLSVDWKVNDQRVRKFAYTYDDLRNRIRQEMTEGDGTVKVESYEYDELNRLVRVTYPDGVVQSYTFDGVGNRLTKTEQFPDGTVKMTSYAYNALNQLVSLTDENGTRVFSYDANGNCVNDGKRLYEWDVQNRLIRVIVPNEGEVRFRYRADGMRVEKQVVGGLTTKYVYDGQTVIGEIRSDGTKRWYVVGAMGYVCRIDEGANGEILARDYFVYDGLGSCRALVSSSGVVVAKYDYDVYGSIRGQEGQRANSFKYVAQIGHPTDEETGLIYMRARYYDPEVGRFVSEDQKRAGMNFYWYADADPINNVDKTGAFSVYVLAALIYSAFVPFFNNPFLRPALEDFIGLPIDQQWVDRLAYYLERYVANYSNIGFIISLIPFPEECRFRPPEHWIEIEGGHCARGRHQFRTMMVNLITLWATIQWFGIVGVEIAFEEGI
jgi:RHS repeat-associated protein